MITGEQAKAAREMLSWSKIDLAIRARVGETTIARLESGKERIRDPIIRAIEDVFKAAGVEFTNDGKPGVRLKTGIRVTRFDRHEDEPDESD